MDIVVVGIGRVGLVTACCLSKSGHCVIGVEIDKNKVKRLNKGISPIHETGIEELLNSGLLSGRLTFSDHLPNPLKAEIAVVAVNTPSLLNADFDISSVHTAVQEIQQSARRPLVLLMKSTVPPGTGNRPRERYLKGKAITYVAQPEFFREGQAVNDWFYPSRIVIGRSDSQAVKKVRRLFSDIEAPILVTDIASAEMMKVVANAFLATKISFINEVAGFCEVVGANIDDVVKGIALDPRIGDAFLQPGLGYGGSCFPKDIEAIDSLSEKNAYEFKMLKATISVNKRQRFLAVHKLERALNGLEGKTIALLGLAFKPNTDDVREAPSIYIAHLLHEEGAKLRVYDPVAMKNAEPLLPKGTVFARDIYSATAGANAVVLVTEWQEFIKADWKAIKKGMSEPYVILDGRNALPQKKQQAMGFKYIGVGRAYLGAAS
jgi:UDPglucose 6-dehydrogenase